MIFVFCTCFFLFVSRVRIIIKYYCAFFFALNITYFLNVLTVSVFLISNACYDCKTNIIRESRTAVCDNEYRVFTVFVVEDITCVFSIVNKVADVCCIYIISFCFVKVKDYNIIFKSFLSDNLCRIFILVFFYIIKCAFCFFNFFDFALSVCLEANKSCSCSILIISKVTK